MTEFVHTASEPTIIGSFNADKAQKLAEDTASKKAAFKEIRLFPDDIDGIDIDLFGIEPNDRDEFIAMTSPYIENVPAVMKMDRRPASNSVNKWHTDTEVSVLNGQATFNIIPVTIGSSSHSTEIVCGDVVFKQDIRKSKVNKNYLLNEAGQRAVDLALQRGDAWLFQPEDGVLDGKIVRFNDPNLHRRNQNIPKSLYRLVIRHHAFS